MYKEFSRERKPEGGKLQRRNIQINICINNNNNNNVIFVLSYQFACQSRLIFFFPDKFKTASFMLTQSKNLINYGVLIQDLN
jgi:hypothetical protein